MNTHIHNVYYTYYVCKCTMCPLQGWLRCKKGSPQNWLSIIISRVYIDRAKPADCIICNSLAWKADTKY